MASSLSSLSTLFLSHPQNQQPKTLISSLLASPRRRSNRKNHLRLKLPPKPQTLEPMPIENPSLTLPIKEQRQEAEAIQESVQELTSESHSLAPSPNHSLIPSTSSLVLDLSLRFAALLAVQTAVAVWLFSSAGGMRDEEAKQEESTLFEGRVVEKEVRENEIAKESSDFERAVLEIREMAREAREREAKEREENEIENEWVVSGNLNAKDPGNDAFGPMKRLGFVKSNVIRRKNVGKGFNGAKKMEDGGDAGIDGGIQQITHQKPMRDSLNWPESEQSTPILSELTEKAADMVGSLVLPDEKSPFIGDLQISRRTFEGRKNNNRTSQLNHNPIGRGIQVKRSLKKEKHPSSAESSDANGRSGSYSQKKKAIKNSTIHGYTDHAIDEVEKPWWLKLPFVLAILLRRGSDRSCPNGLYSLKVDSPWDDRGLASYTIVFQDQGDATNFCHLLETFFEGLDDFSADVVPLTIDELEEEVSLGALKVIVVRKGQLQLYAGQPLIEVETALRSLLV